MSDYWDSDESDGEPYFRLKEEIRDGRYHDVLAALNSGADPNETDSDSGDYTLLHWAAGMTDEENLQEIGLKGPFFNIPTRKRIVRLLLDRGAQAWCVWWQVHFLGNHTGQRTWDLTEDDSTRKMLQEKCVDQVLNRIEEESHDLSTDSEAETGGLVAAAALNRTDAIMLLHRTGVDIDDDCCDVTALSVASALDSFEAVKVLVEHCGANIDHDVDQRGRTALRCAAEAGHNRIVTYLLEKGADPFIEKECMGPTPMYVESKEVLDTLLEVMHVMVQRKITALEGHENRNVYPFSTAFHVFTAFGYIDGLYTLFQGGIDPPPDCLQTAVAFGHIEALELLLAEGALKTYDKSKKRCWYGPGGPDGRNFNTEPPDRIRHEAQKRLDETAQAANDFAQRASHFHEP